jgi:hypothetical protein
VKILFSRVSWALCRPRRAGAAEHALARSVTADAAGSILWYAELLKAVDGIPPHPLPCFCRAGLGLAHGVQQHTHGSGHVRQQEQPVQSVLSGALTCCSLTARVNLSAILSRLPVLSVTVSVCVRVHVHVLNGVPSVYLCHLPCLCAQAAGRRSATVVSIVVAAMPSAISAHKRCLACL